MLRAKYQGVKYLRLSYTGDKTNESDSIANQRRLIDDFVKGSPDIELVDEFVDDGYSGVLFDRPQFQRMMDEIKAGRVNCVIVKDLSRLGREYIETGRFLERIFPAYGVRFIAVTDGIDTAHKSSSDDLALMMKNIINDTYCHDISVKTRTALNVKRQNGDYVGACPIYGYRKAPDNRNRLVVDDDAARVVRDIYRRKIDGVSAQKIADALNGMGIPSPLAYKISRGLPHPTGGFSDSAGAKWSAKTVLRILQDETYTGVLIQGRQGTHNHKLKDVVQKPENEWVRVEGTHEAIVGKRDFELVQKLLRLDTRTSPDSKNVYLFSGLLICGCCGANMRRKTNTVNGKKYVYYHCPTGKKSGCAHPVLVREDELTQCVLESAQAHIRSAASLDDLLDSINEERINRDAIAGLKARIAENESKLEQDRRFKTTLYENFIGGLLSKKDYQQLKDDYSERMEKTQEAIALLRGEMERISRNDSERQKWTRHFKEFSTMTELDRRAVVALIESIRVVGKTELEITFRYQMEYEAAVKLLARRGEASAALMLLFPALAMLEKEAG